MAAGVYSSRPWPLLLSPLSCVHSHLPAPTTLTHSRSRAIRCVLYSVGYVTLRVMFDFLARDCCGHFDSEMTAGHLNVIVTPLRVLL